MRPAGRWILIALVALGGLVYCYVAVVRPRSVADVTQILRLNADVERAVEQRRPSEIMGCISQDYEDPSGNTYRALQRLLIGAGRAQGTLELSVQAPELEVAGDTATFAAEVDLASAGQISSEAMTHLTVTGQLRKERGRWKVVSATGWQGAEAAYY